MITLTIDNPYTLEPACSVPLAEPDEVHKILDRARGAAAAFGRTAVAERIALCRRALEKLKANEAAIAADITRMMGKPLNQAKNEVAGTAARWTHMCDIAAESLADVQLPPKDGFERRVVKAPLGVVLDLPAWNYPLLTAVNAVVPAVLAGNVVVLKHSPRSPLIGGHFARAFAEAGAPDGVVQALDCDHATSERMVGDSRVDHVLFTGSVFGGHRIQVAAADRFIGLGLELGGNDPAYVAADSDVEKAAESLVDGALYNAGQSCCAIERVYVHEALYAKFVAACEPLIRAYVLGDPMDPKTTLGPIAQPNHPAELASFVHDATAKGAKVVAGGQALAVEGRGRFFAATLIEGVTQEMALFQRESFGPILAIGRVTSDDEALRRMNDSRLGLTAAVYTKDRERAARMAAELQAGTVFMNRCDALDPALPWVGWKDSGRGVTLSSLGFDHLTRPKSIHFKLAL